MPRRYTTFFNGGIYHVISRSVHQKPILSNPKNAQAFSDTLRYYSQNEPPIKFSYFKRNKNIYKINLDNRLITIIAYCIMPTHIHLLLKQEKDQGTRLSIQKTLNAYAHYYNLKNEQRGPVFEPSFRAILVTSESQFLHLSRYIHLNPVSSYLTENPQDYQFSSCQMYIDGNYSSPFDPSLVLNCFKNSKEYLKFLMDRKDYQRELENIKHLLLE